jgi:hypothetical protein
MRSKAVYSESLNPEIRGDAIIYGAGFNCVNFLIKLIRSGDMNKFRIVAVVDADPAKAGTEVLGRPVVSVDRLSELDKALPVIVTPEKRVAAITAFLTAKGFGDIWHLDKGAYGQMLTAKIMRGRYLDNKDFYDNALKQNERTIARLRAALADDRSRDIMDAFIESRFRGDYTRNESYISKPEYYPDDIVKLGGGRGFLGLRRV